MRLAAPHPAFRYGGALLSALVFSFLWVRSDPFGQAFTLLLAVVAIVLNAGWGGIGPGLVATAITGAGTVLMLVRDPSSNLGYDLSIGMLLVLVGLALSGALELWRRSETLARARAAQQAAIAELSRRALSRRDLDALLHDACDLALRVLGVERVGIRRSAAAGSAVLAEARAGGGERAIGAVAGPNELLPVARVEIAAEGSAFADLEASHTEPREVSPGELDFLHVIANLVAATVARERADRDAERHRERDALLAEIGSILSSPLDFPSRARELARGVVPRLAEWCIVDLVEPSGELERVAVEHADEARADLAERIRTTHALHVHDDHPVVVAFRSGNAQLVPHVGESDLRRMALDEAHLETLRRAGLTSLMCVPLRARGRILGVVSFGGAGRPAYGTEDLELAEEVAARAALAFDNARLYEKVLADDRAKDEFLAMLAHELRNPLAPMVHSLEVFRVASPDSEARERARRVLERQVTQLRHLVRDLLDVARITRGTIELRRQPVELSAAVANAIESCQPLIQAHRHHVAIHLPAHPVWLDADPTRLEQILTNLINNAVEHSRPETRTDVSAEIDGERVTIHVKDDGSGLTPEALAHVFDLFARGDILESGPGTGIGLHLVRRLVELHGGTIEARSPGPGRGSEFVVRLPLALRAPRGGAEPKRAAEAAGRLRILVVDDHMDSAAALSELLTLWGYEVATAVDGREALRTAAGFRPELVLLDLAMPDMNGYQVAREMRRMPELAGTTLVALTGHVREPSRETASGFEFDQHWMKPLDVSALRAFVEERSRHRHNAYA